MCQTSVLMEKDGSDEVVLENVTTLEVVDKGLKISTLFEGSQELVGAVINRIDFAGGKVYLTQS